MKKTNTKRLQLLHIYYKRTGFYPFLMNTLLKVFIGLGSVIVLLMLFERHVVSIDTLMDYMLTNFPTWGVLLFFYVGESILGFLPPDLFILWSNSFENTWGMLTLIGTISFCSGITAYWLGVMLLKWDKLRNYMELKFANYLDMLHKWGGVLIILAALFPLPYASVCTLSGIVGFPFRLFLLFSVTRYLRFYLYALILYSVF